MQFCLQLVRQMRRMQQYRVRILFGTVATAGLLACGLVDALAWRVDRGLLSPPTPDYDVVVVPSSVTATQAFEVTVTTFGSSSCTRAAGAEVTVSGLMATVVPMDSFPSDPATVCTQDIAGFPRTVTFEFATPGSATVLVSGRAVTGDTTIERTITVGQ